MKNNIKIIIAFVLGLIISAVGVYAINANNITYNDTTLDKALDEVYANLDTKKVLNSFGTVQYGTSQGTAKNSRTASLELSKGKYIVATNSILTWNDKTSYTSSHGLYTDPWNIYCTSANCIVRRLSSYHNQPKATEAVGGYYSITSAVTSLYYLEVNNDNDTIKLTGSAGSDYNSGVHAVTLEALPIN